MERVLLFKKNNCAPCTNLSNELQKTEVDFQYDIINIEDEENLELCEKHRIRKVPTAIIIDENGEKLKQLNGNIDGELSLELISKTFNSVKTKRETQS